MAGASERRYFGPVRAIFAVLNAIEVAGVCAAVFHAELRAICKPLRPQRGPRTVSNVKKPQSQSTFLLKPNSLQSAQEKKSVFDFSFSAEQDGETNVSFFFFYTWHRAGERNLCFSSQVTMSDDGQTSKATDFFFRIQNGDAF